MKVTTDIERQILERYMRGESACSISKTLNISDQTVYRYLQKNGIERRNKGSYRQHNLSIQKLTDFNIPETQYWLGFIYADGHLENKGSGGYWYGISLTLSIKDKKHLEKFKKFIGYDGRIIIHKVYSFGKEWKLCRLSLYSKKLVEILQLKGFSKKTIPKELLVSPHFWRGVIDGDGWFMFIKEKRYRPKWNKIYEMYRLDLGLCGDDYTILAFNNFVKTLVGKELIIRNKKQSKNGSVYLEGIISGKKAYEIGKKIYQNAKVYLERKKEIFNLAKAYYERKE